MRYMTDSEFTMWLMGRVYLIAGLILVSIFLVLTYIYDILVATIFLLCLEGVLCIFVVVFLGIFGIAMLKEHIEYVINKRRSQ